MYKNIFTGEDYSDETLEQVVDGNSYEGCSFKTCDFSLLERVEDVMFDECNFTSARLNGVTFKNCAFLNCKFKYARLFGTIFENCKMTGSSFEGSDCELIEIKGGDWSYCDLRYLNFYKQDFSNIRFRECDMSGTEFRKCTLRNCDFHSAIMDGASFEESDIRGSDINGSDLRVVSFKKAKIDLQQCVLLAEQLSGGQFETED